MIDLKKFEIFFNLPDHIIVQLASHALFRKFPRRSFIFLEGEESNFIYFVQHGSVKIFKSNQEGREQILSCFEKGDVFNLVSMILDENPTHNANAQALSEVELFLIPRKFFFNLMKENLELSFNVTKLLASRVKEMTELSVNLGIRDVRSRLAGFLIKQADGNASSAMITQDEIAAHIGSVRDVVGRLLREFEVKGLIRKVRHQIVLLDRLGLESIAGIEP